MPEPARVVVVDDHPLFRDGLIHTLQGDPRFVVVGEGGSAGDAARLAREFRPDLMLLDVSMPGGGLEAVAAVSDVSSLIRVVMLTVSEDEQVVVAALRAGARGYVLKGVGGEELRNVLQSIHEGEVYLSPALAIRVLTDGAQRKEDAEEGRSALSERESEILDHVARGLSNKEIALALDLSEKTIKHYMTSLFQKLQVRNRTEAALLATRHKI
jgi:two-component system nitrate/nitrite response regulator NarL